MTPHVHTFEDPARAAKAGAALVANVIVDACETLLHHVSVDWRHVYRIEGEIDPPTAAGRYETTIRASFGDAAFSDVPRLRADRITMTLPLLNAARRVLFFVTGADKAAAVRAVLASSGGSVAAPAARVQPHEGRVDWILDSAAAA